MMYKKGEVAIQAARGNTAANATKNSDAPAPPRADLHDHAATPALLNIGDRTWQAVLATKLPKHLQIQVGATANDTAINSNN